MWNCLPPEGSKYSDVGLFDDLSLDLVHMHPDNKYYVLLMGDFNSRTANQSDISYVDLCILMIYQMTLIIPYWTEIL